MIGVFPFEASSRCSASASVELAKGVPVHFPADRPGSNEREQIATDSGSDIDASLVRVEVS
jgi:hypothetical protein